MTFSPDRSGTHQKGKLRRQEPFGGIDPHVSRKLRRARARLDSRIKGYEDVRNKAGYIKPGSMKMR